MSMKDHDLTEDMVTKLLENSNKRYDFVEAYNQYIKIARDYGTGETINMVEVHTLTLIADQPGIMAKDVALMWNRTKGAVSQTLAKLEKRGLIERRKEDGNAKNIHLYVTAAGQKLSDAHHKYDLSHLLLTDTAVSNACTNEEMETFYKVLNAYTEAIKDITK